VATDVQERTERALLVPHEHDGYVGDVGREPSEARRFRMRLEGELVLRKTLEEPARPLRFVIELGNECFGESHEVPFPGAWILSARMDVRKLQEAPAAPKPSQGAAESEAASEVAGNLLGKGEGADLLGSGRPVHAEPDAARLDATDEMIVESHVVVLRQRRRIEGDEASDRRARGRRRRFSLSRAFTLSSWSWRAFAVTWPRFTSHRRSSETTSFAFRTTLSDV
jgi:hypothetical protein